MAAYTHPEASMVDKGLFGIITKEKVYLLGNNIAWFLIAFVTIVDGFQCQAPGENVVLV